MGTLRVSFHLVDTLNASENDLLFRSETIVDAMQIEKKKPRYSRQDEQKEKLRRRKDERCGDPRGGERHRERGGGGGGNAGGRNVARYGRVLN